MHWLSLLTVLAIVCVLTSAIPAESAPDRSRGDRILAEYFRVETGRLSGRSLSQVQTADQWRQLQGEFRGQLREMLGLEPLPEKTPLNAVVTGKADHPAFTVERVQFQSRPGLYVTGSLYVPKGLKGRAPAILYVCGHGNVKENGISYGSKVSYQHHGGWFARNGYVCLIIDTLQLGEIEGLHHGTYREGRWWWNARGYTPAGVEAWNCIRSLDYLQARPEVDGARLGVTGRSGGGAYSWWIAALDERIKAAVPVAGITDLQNHVVDGTVEGHCDCMFMVNTYRWDYAHVASLVAPRPLLISNSDKDTIFPLEGVVRVHAQVRRIYQMLGAADRLGLLITEGPHRDTQDLQVPALRWFDRFLKQEQPLVETAAIKYFMPEQLRVFSALPKDERNTQIDETFVTAASPTVPADAQSWAQGRNSWLRALVEKSFAGWPSDQIPLAVRRVFAVEREGIQFSAYDFNSQEAVPLRLYVVQRSGLVDADLAVLNVLGQTGSQAWPEWLATMGAGFPDELQQELAADPTQPDREGYDELKGMLTRFKWAMAYVAPRGVGPTAWDESPRKQVQNRRRFMLLGQTLAGMQVWDVRRAVQALRTRPEFRVAPLWLQGHRETAVTALYASLFEPEIARLDLWELPASHRETADYLNVLRFLDIPQAVTMAVERSRVKLYNAPAGKWSYVQETIGRLSWDSKRLELRAVKQ
jgi:dienelactone hydrolase